MGKCFLGNLPLNVPKGVYVPREDSFLLAEAIGVREGETVLDLGCGSGVQGISALENGAGSVLFADVDRAAVKAALGNAEALGFAGRVQGRESDLFGKVPERFGLVAFNPPYVASGERRWADVDGGKEGREVLDRFLQELPRHLEKGGKCFFAQSSLNGEGKTRRLLAEAGLKGKRVAGKRLFFEELVVYRAEADA